jgi:hypothetical protein
MTEPIVRPRPLPLTPGNPLPVAYLWSDVLDELRFNGAWRTDRAAVGLLVGSPALDPTDQAAFVEIEGFVANAFVTDASGFTGHLRQAWREAGALVRRDFGDAEIIGWYAALPSATPPGQGEIVLHNTFFPKPWQVGLWIEPGVAPRALRVGPGRLLDAPVEVLRAAEDRAPGPPAPVDSPSPKG